MKISAFMSLIKDHGVARESAWLLLQEMQYNKTKMTDTLYRKFLLTDEKVGMTTSAAMLFINTHYRENNNGN